MISCNQPHVGTAGVQIDQGEKVRTCIQSSSLVTSPYFHCKMARPSSEAGYDSYIGTAENSSCSKIKSNINLQVVEATGESDEICGLERKECDEIMEHLNNNPGLVVKSLGPEGQVVLHVAVMTGETKKPKPPTPKPINQGLREAANESEWYRALKAKDCKVLMTLLEAHPFLVAQTGPEGWTVLHAAVHRGCLQLIDQVFDLFKDKDHFVDEMSGVRISWTEFLKARCAILKVKVKHIAWFTCPRQVYEALKYRNLNFGESFSLTQHSNSDASQHLRDKVVEIMQRETSKLAFGSIEDDYQSDVDYNFVLERKELKFHYACKKLSLGFGPYYKEYKLYVKTIIRGCLNLGTPESVEVLTYLFQLHNAQGQTPLHLASKYASIKKLVELLPRGDAYKGCLNAKDVRGWTVLHYVAATRDHRNLKALLQDERVDVNAKTGFTPLSNDFEESGMTALHLAILHNDVENVKQLLKCPHMDVHALFKRYIQCGYEREKLGEHHYDFFKTRLYWSPLQLAAIMGLSDVVRALLGSKQCEIYNDKKLQNTTTMEKNFQRVSALLFAAASGNPNTLRLFLDNPMFDPLAKFEGATALHYATNAMTPKYIYTEKFRVGHFLLFSDLGHLNVNTCRYEEEPMDIEMTPRLYLGRQACVTMLLQAGVDIWEKDNRGRFADPGPRAPKEAQLWWHEKMAQETLEAKKSLNDAANAIAVVAALVATASFVGPLQPPLGYGGDSIEGGVQDTHLSIRVFMVSNNLSFYLAIASILFAVVPSLPMPQEGIYLEWLRTQRTVAMAIFFLLMSVLGVLISFGAASNSVVSEEYSWRHDGLLFYPTLVGGFICILGISLFFLRLLRLVFNGNAKIRYFYKTFVRF